VAAAGVADRIESGAAGEAGMGVDAALLLLLLLLPRAAQDTLLAAVSSDEDDGDGTDGSHPAAAGSRQRSSQESRGERPERERGADPFPSKRRALGFGASVLGVGCCYVL